MSEVKKIDKGIMKVTTTIGRVAIMVVPVVAGIYTVRMIDKYILQNRVNALAKD